MHEMGIALQVIDAVTARAGGARVKRVVVEVGALTAVLPDALKFSFEVATRGTRAEGALLDVALVKGQARCRACGSTLDLERPFGRCGCGGSDLDWLSGDELRIKEMEVE